MKWKGKINAGTIFSPPVISLDIFATIASVIGIDLPTDRKFDGVNLIPFVNLPTGQAGGENHSAPHDILFWRSDFNKAVRKGDWKLIVNEFDNVNQLYNLKTDSVEKHNLYSQKPEVANELLKNLEDWENELIKPLWPRVVNYVYKDDEGKYVFAF